MPEVDGSGGATRRGGRAGTGNVAMVIRPSPEQMGAPTSYPRLLRTLRDDPELKGGVAGGVLAAGNRGGGGGKGADDSGAIEANQGAGEHTRGSMSSLEKSERLERGRRSTATRSSDEQKRSPAPATWRETGRQ